jgi:hypothetical protein
MTRGFSGRRFDERGKRPVNAPFFMKDERHSMCTGEKDDFIANPDINLVGAPYGCRKNLREIDGKILGFPLMTPWHPEQKRFSLASVSKKD